MIPFEPETKSYKKAFSTEGEQKGKEARFENAPENLRLDLRGLAGGALAEPQPSFITTSSEKIVKGANNQWIVFGRDRLQSRLSGYGGRGDTQAGSIDIVIGRYGAFAQSVDDTGQKVWCDPSVKYDAARIYISQKTDVDDNFYLADGQVGNAKTKSAIALKADGIRIVAREGIKLITRTDAVNSQGGEIAEAVGIDLLATNNDEDLQPIPKGNNLKEALDKLTCHVSKLNGIVDSLLMYQTSFNEALTHHTHIAPLKIIPSPAGVGFVWETAPSLPVVSKGIKTMIDHLSQTKRSLMTHKSNLAMYKFKYFNPAGSKYINSRYNNTT
jgi:hypothetical protein